MYRRHTALAWIFISLMRCGAASAADRYGKRLVVIDQDGSGPGGSNQWSMLLLLQAPDVEVLGISMVTGNAWMERETAHTLRMLELMSAPTRGSRRPAIAD